MSDGVGRTLGPGPAGGYKGESAAAVGDAGAAVGWLRNAPEARMIPHCSAAISENISFNWKHAGTQVARLYFYRSMVPTWSQAPIV